MKVGKMTIIANSFWNCLIPGNPDANKAKPVALIRAIKYQETQIASTKKPALM
jgi:hypothetical protein